jgi:XTP/dITP diphosphohydrolase
MKPLLLASRNPGKLREMAALLNGTGVQFVTPDQLGLELVVEESGETYAENAAKKAQVYACASGLISLGDDSGLEVDALGGLPGIRSARFAPQPGATDADRRATLLDRLRGVPRPWKAHFHCTVSLATPEGLLRFTDGECFGEIIPEQRGTNGFGYDPIFFIPELGKTMAELSMEEKNLLSHRARAVRSAVPILTEMLSAPG